MITALEIVWQAGIKKQTVIIEDSISKNQAAIDFLGDNITLLWWCKVGDMVTITFVMRVNMQWRFFNRLSGSTITRHSWPDDV